jgi:hypothetical protein
MTKCGRSLVGGSESQLRVDYSKLLGVIASAADAIACSTPMSSAPASDAGGGARGTDAGSARSVDSGSDVFAFEDLLAPHSRHDAPDPGTAWLLRWRGLSAADPPGRVVHPHMCCLQCLKIVLVGFDGRT